MNGWMIINALVSHVHSYQTQMLTLIHTHTTKRRQEIPTRFYAVWTAKCLLSSDALRSLYYDKAVARARRSVYPTSWSSSSSSSSACTNHRFRAFTRPNIVTPISVEAFTLTEEVSAKKAQSLLIISTALHSHRQARSTHVALSCKRNSPP